MTKSKHNQLKLPDFQVPGPPYSRMVVPTPATPPDLTVMPWTPHKWQGTPLSASLVATEPMLWAHDILVAQSNGNPAFANPVWSAPASYGVKRTSIKPSKSLIFAIAGNSSATRLAIIAALQARPKFAKSGLFIGLRDTPRMQAPVIFPVRSFTVTSGTLLTGLPFHTTDLVTPPPGAYSGVSTPSGLPEVAFPGPPDNLVSVGGVIDNSFYTCGTDPDAVIGGDVLAVNISQASPVYTLMLTGVSSVRLAPGSHSTWITVETLATGVNHAGIDHDVAQVRASLHNFTNFRSLCYVPTDVEPASYAALISTVGDSALCPDKSSVGDTASMIADVIAEAIAFFDL